VFAPGRLTQELSDETLSVIVLPAAVSAVTPTPPPKAPVTDDCFGTKGVDN
jgi:hypothetical protein